jgi:hypothetical protein
MSQTTSLPDVRVEPAHWALVSDERGGGFVMATVVGSSLHVHVGDPAPQGTGREHDGGLVTAVLDGTGSVVVETTTTPPALLVARDGTRLLPAQPGQELPTRMREGDRLVLCSASGLDEPPAGLLHLLRCVADDLLRVSPEHLLTTVLEGVDEGAATVIARTPPGPAATTGDDSP